MRERVLEVFKTHFVNPRIIVRAPGRANIIGEHTDYNHGLVLPFAIRRSIWMAMSANNLGKLRMFAVNLDESAELAISDLTFQSEGWTRYFINSLVALGYTGDQGFDIAFGGDLPSGGGVSSSSALACAFLSGVTYLASLDLDQNQLISLASQAENGIGLNGGIMDQTAIIKGLAGHAMMIDFVDNSLLYVPMIDRKYNFYLFDSGQKHNLVETAYNERRATCEDAVTYIQTKDKSVQTMRDISMDHIDTYLSDDEVATKRCRHVVNENARVLATVAAMEEGDMIAIGKLLNESHTSLRSDYEVSTPEIDDLITESQNIDKILGCRIMGGGFGGCTINLVEGELTEEDIAHITAQYIETTGLKMKVLKILADDGVRIEVL